MKNFIYAFLFLITCFNLNSVAFSEEFDSQVNDPVFPVSSLLYHVHEAANETDVELKSVERISIEADEVDNLWDKAFTSYDSLSPFCTFLLQRAKESYYQGNQNLSSAKKYLQQSLCYLESLWLNLNDQDLINEDHKKIEAAFNNAPFDARSISLRRSQSVINGTKGVKDFLKPFLLPDSHPLKSKMDAIFCSDRASLNRESFDKAGFITKFVQPRSHILVASHPYLPGHLLKVVLDSELRLKKDKPEWYWFVKRCEGARRIRHVIKKYHIKKFNVPKKWIYELPAKPQPPDEKNYLPKKAVLLVEDMNLVSEEKNLHAWENKITRKHLDELYIIISKASGGSYRASNIPYSKNGQFMFIDTEYPDNKHPDFQSIKRFLSYEMQNYWDGLVRNGGH